MSEPRENSSILFKYFTLVNEVTHLGAVLTAVREFALRRALTRLSDILSFRTAVEAVRSSLERRDRPSPVDTKCLISFKSSSLLNNMHEVTSEIYKETCGVASTQKESVDEQLMKMFFQQLRAIVTTLRALQKKIVYLSRCVRRGSVLYKYMRRAVCEVAAAKSW